MKLKEAKQLFEKILEISYQTENFLLIENVVRIYPEIKQSSEINQIIELAEELQINIDEIDFLPEELDDVSEILDNIEKLFE